VPGACGAKPSCRQDGQSSDSADSWV